MQLLFLFSSTKAHRVKPYPPLDWHPAAVEAMKRSARQQQDQGQAVTHDDGNRRGIMIQGLKVTVKASELRALCQKQAALHEDRAAFYKEKAKALEGMQSNGPNYGTTGQDPRQQMLAKQTEHQNAFHELEFVAEHLTVGEEYLLDSADLRRLGIIRNAHQFF